MPKSQPKHLRKERPAGRRRSAASAFGYCGVGRSRSLPKICFVDPQVELDCQISEPNQVDLMKLELEIVLLAFGGSSLTRYPNNENFDGIHDPSGKKVVAT